MKTSEATIIIIAIIVVVLIVLIYLIHLGYTGATQTRSIISSAISSSIDLYKQEFQMCAEEYAKAFQTFLQNSPQGFTESELRTLQQLQNCMNQAAGGIAKIAESLGQNPLDVLTNYIGEGILSALAAAGIGYGISKIVQSLKTYSNRGTNNGAAAANIMSNAIIRYNLEKGIITPDQAAGVGYFLNNVYNINVTGVTNFASYLVSINVFTIDQATSFVNFETNLMYEDTSLTDRFLSSPPPPPPPVPIL